MEDGFKTPKSESDSDSEGYSDSSNDDGSIYEDSGGSGNSDEESSFYEESGTNGDSDGSTDSDTFLSSFRQSTKATEIEKSHVGEVIDDIVASYADDSDIANEDVSAVSDEFLSLGWPADDLLAVSRIFF